MRADTTVRWFEAAADSVTFRAVTARLIHLGFIVKWPTSFGADVSDLPVATLTLRAPGQGHQTSASPELRRTPPKGMARGPRRAGLVGRTHRLAWALAAALGIGRPPPRCDPPQVRDGDLASVNPNPRMQLTGRRGARFPSGGAFR
jgi:hypothetical protein